MHAKTPARKVLSLANYAQLVYFVLIMDYLELVLVALLVVLISKLWSALLHLAWRPYAITKWFRQQGIEGPEYKFFVGSTDKIKRMNREGEELILDIQSHDFFPRIQPYYQKWISLYGPTFLFWFGPKPTLCVSDLDLVKQILSDRTGLFPKNDMVPAVVALLGNGLILSDGALWARHRKVVGPAFSLDKLKIVTDTTAECARSMLQGWHVQQVQHASEVEIEVCSQFEELTADVITHTAFGSSYEEGKQVFAAQKELEMLVLASHLDVQIPGFDYLPTRRNRDKWRLNRKVRSILMQIIRNRLATKESGYGNDLLGLMLEASESDKNQNKEGWKMSMDEIIDECKTFFFAGHETTSHLLTWTIFLLSTNLEWQERLREEVLRECGKEAPNPEMLGKLKLVTMVLNETLRLYGPVQLLQRKAAKDVELGNVKIPEGMSLFMPIGIMHRDKKTWGPDANEFNPLRFENGITKAAEHPNALLAFSIGPRLCIGQNFAMLEAKVVIAMILQKFSFYISPKYVHAPIKLITLQPKYGLPIVSKLLDG